MSREMKKSGIEWIGTIPADWNVSQLRMFFGRRIHKNKELKVKNLLSLSYGNVIRKNIETKEGLLPESFDGYNIVEPGDIVIRGTDLQNDHRSLRTGLVTEHGIITSAYMTLLPITGVNSEYYHYLLHSYDLAKVFYSMGGGLRQSLDYWDFCRMLVLHPLTSEQRQIVHFLDRKCSAIDTAIEKTKESIEKLEKYKKSVIAKAVTKGLDPDAKMKDSGVEWIGEVPGDWEVSRFKYHTRLKKDRNPGNATVLSLYREYGVVIKDSRDDNFNRTSLDTSSYRYVEKDDFVVNKMKAWQGSVAVSDYDGIVSPAYYVYRITDKKIYPRYFHYLMRGCYKDEFRRLSGGIRIGQWDLPSYALENTLILKPSFDEQAAIANYIDKR